MPASRFLVSLHVDLVDLPSGERVLGLPGARIAMAQLAPGAQIDDDGAGKLVRAWMTRNGAMLSMSEADRVLAGAPL